MKALDTVNKHLQYITGKSGKSEYVVLPVNDFQKLIDIIEEYGLGLAMEQAKNDKFYSKKQAQKML